MKNRKQRLGTLALTVIGLLSAAACTSTSSKMYGPTGYTASLPAHYTFQSDPAGAYLFFSADCEEWIPFVDEDESLVSTPATWDCDWPSRIPANATLYVVAVWPDETVGEIYTTTPADGSMHFTWKRPISAEASAQNGPVYEPAIAVGG